jgi:putative Mn2+ efflux pump MntP
LLRGFRLKSARQIGLYLSPEIANTIGAVLLLGVGLWVFTQPVATALKSNALAGGFDAGAVGISSLLESILVGIFSFITIAIGWRSGQKYAAEQLGKYATVVSGTLLMLIAAHQLWG